MKCLRLLLAGVAVALSSVAADSSTATAAVDVTTTSASDATRCFPDDFLFGSATAAYQVEGAWNESGRTTSIWDDFCREKPGYECANVADDFFHRYKDDIKLMVASGLDSFRFSISWSRAMNWDASTKKMKANPAGIAFYHALIDELNRNKITPILTLYHWDLPSELHQQLKPQGWLNREIVDHFVQYSELMFTEFGSKVSMWTTFNEPWSFVTQGYGTGAHAPGFTNSTTNTYTAAHNLLIAHAKAVQRFRELKKSSVVNDKARIGIVLVDHYAYPLNASDPRDVAAAERRIQFGLGWYLSPIVSGKYPDIMRERVGDRLPEFTAEEAALLKGSYDLFMLNHYSSHSVTDCDSETSLIKCTDLSLGWERDHGVDELRAPDGARLSSKSDAGAYNCVWFTGYPAGYLEIIRWTHAHNPKADILLTENGWCGNDSIENMDQLWYFQSYIGEVYRAITEFKIPIIGYTAWSFVDNYEWGSFKPRFGLYYVNFTSETGLKDEVTPGATALTRIPRPAAKWYAQVAKTKCLDGFAIEGVPDLVPATVAIAAASASSSFKPIVVWGLVLGVVFGAPALAFFIKRRRSRQSTLLRSGENTPLVRGQ
ncbi:Beta-glucosidase [Globisporangium polare]